jgi:hypothetical protein
MGCIVSTRELENQVIINNVSTPRQTGPNQISLILIFDNNGRVITIPVTNNSNSNNSNNSNNNIKVNIPKQLNLTEDKLCVICQQEDTKMCQFKCNHVFHQECIKQWIETSSLCPICKVVLR